ncbi:hypothetical protein BCR44DRAFT_1178288 [Catenaria anguillulae PL171]|uniref:Csf1 C-terminal region domain-containing protein n=1 Tax=Catenaria anguillulae PL171 TaxID=765915 RepID=A0A1Y2HJS6_9FUNG|nr:hypothetical protein BCR44DRAFT_1178288 [Catenaria anguillulae PL171]
MWRLGAMGSWPVSATPTTSAAASSAAALSGSMANSQPQSQPQQAPVPIPHRQTKLIAQVPKSDLSMTTWTVSDAASAVNNSISSSTSSTALLGQTNPGQVVVRHVFTTQFDGMIDLALNMILYRNLQDVIELYESEISRTMRTLQIIAGPSQEEKAIKFVLEPVEPPVLVPRLRVMGEATPPLEWLVKKELVPELAHTTVTLPLDGFLRSLASSFS